MSAELASVLIATLDANPNTRIAAELRLSELFTLPDSGIALASILLASDADPSLRQMSPFALWRIERSWLILASVFYSAGIVLKKYVQEYWSTTFPQHKGPVPPPAAKNQIRGIVFSGLSDPQRKIRTSCAFVLSFIAKADWPDEYPTLLNDLLMLLSTNDTNAIHGAMQLFAEFIKDELAEDQILPVLRQLLPILLEILGSHDHHPITRARAIAVFRQCVTALDMVRKEYPAAVKEALSTVLPRWLEAFGILLEQDALADVQDPNNWDSLSIRIQVFKTLDVIQKNFSQAVGSYTAGFLRQTVANLTTLMPPFRKHYLLPDNPPPMPLSTDDPDINLSFMLLAYPAMDFIAHIVSSRKLLVLEDDQVTNLVQLALYWAQITTEDEDIWEEDANAFVREDTESIEAETARTASLDLISDLLDEYPKATAQALWTVAKDTFQQTQQAKQSGQPDWWRPLEAVLAALQGDSVEDVIEEAKSSGTPSPINLEEFLGIMLPALVNESGTSFLQGRALVAASSFARQLPSQLVGLYLEAALGVLESVQAIAPVKAAALKAVRNFCSVEDDLLISPLCPRIVEALAPALKKAKEDTLGLALEALSTAIQVDEGKWLDIEKATQVVKLLLETYQMNVNDPIALSILTDIFTFLASSKAPDVYKAVVLATVPNLAPTVANNTGWICCSALQILTALVTGAGVGQLGDGVVAALAPSLFVALEKTPDPEVHSEGIHLLTVLLRKDAPQLLAWEDPATRTPALGRILAFVERLLAPDMDEGVGLGVGDLLVNLLRKAGDALVPFLAPLLQALVRRLAIAKTATFSQSLIVPFIFLIQTQRDVVLELLENTPVDGGKTGLHILLEAWSENAETFIGNWSSRISHLALGSLFLSERPTLQQVFVKGDIIIKPETSNVIVTRSRAKTTPHEYSNIPFTLKALKLIIRGLQTNGDAATISAKNATFDAVSTDGEDDEEWDDEDRANPTAVLLSVAEALQFEHDDQPGGLDDDDLAEDPIMQIDLTAHTIAFLKECAKNNVNQFATLVDQLNAEEMIIVRQALSD